MVAFLPIVHRSGSHDEVQNLGLTPPNHGQMLGGSAGVMGHLPSADDSGLMRTKGRLPILIRLAVRQTAFNEHIGLFSQTDTQH